MNSGWCTIESDPGVFTGLISELGAKGLQVEELYGLDEELLKELHPIYGLIFLFKWDSDIQNSQKSKSLESPSSASGDIFFAQQTVQNACATQAILSVLLNIPNTVNGVDLGMDLANFRDFSKDLTPELRGEAIREHELIRNVHNSFSRPELVYINDKQDQRKNEASDEDPFHFVSFVPIGDGLYEFDGLRDGPLFHGKVEGDSWYPIAVKAVQDKIADIQANGSGEIRFNLMAVIRDRSTLYRERIDQQIRLICQLEDSIRLNASSEGNNDPRQQQISNLLAANADLEGKLEQEQLKIAQYKRENARRRHNFVPLAVSLLEEMAKSGLLKKHLSTQ